MVHESRLDCCEMKSLNEDIDDIFPANHMHEMCQDASCNIHLNVWLILLDTIFSFILK